MCGIISSITKNPKKVNIVDKVLKQFEAQKDRGLQGFGFVAVDDKKLTFVRTTTEKEIKEELAKLQDCSLLMFHHRIPTSSPNKAKANHPIKIENDKLFKYNYYLVHNGHIWNDDELKTQHEALGYKYSSIVNSSLYGDKVYSNKVFTDTEALGVEMALMIEGHKKTMDATGGIACFLLQTTKTNKPLNLFYFRNSNPIKFYHNQSGIFLSSEGKGRELPEDVMFCYNIQEHKLEFRKPFKVGHYTYTETISTNKEGEDKTTDELNQSLQME